MAKKKADKKSGYADGIIDAVQVLNQLKGNSRKEHFVLIDQCIGAVSDLIPDPVEEQPEVETPEAPAE